MIGVVKEYKTSPRMRDGTRLSVHGFSVPKDGLAPGELAALKKELTAVPVMAGKPQPSPGSGAFELWRESPSRLYLPGWFGTRRFGLPAKDTVPDGVDAVMDFHGELRSEQQAPVQAFLAAAADPHRRGGIVSLPCGGGKTVVALYIVARVAKKTLIVVHKDFLLQQWQERISLFLPTARVGVVKAKRLDVRDKDIVLASLQSLSMKEYASDVFADVGLMIIDEVHRTGTEVFSRALQKFGVRRCLGLSATVHRKDGMSKVFTWFIGDIVYAGAPATGERVDVHVYRFQDPNPAYCEEPEAYGGKLNLSRMINNIASFAPRTRALAFIVKDTLAQEPSRRILVLSDRKQHLRDIDALVHVVAPSVSTGFYVGGMKPEALAESQDRDVILATYSFASEGFDVPGLDTLIMASPKTDIEQSVGRVLRQKSSDRKCVPRVIDVLDEFSVFVNQGKKRKAYYKRRGYRVEVKHLCPEQTRDISHVDTSHADDLHPVPTEYAFRDEA